jgi:hypothetical protein
MPNELPAVHKADGAEKTTQRLARVTGLLYLLLGVTAMFAALVVEGLFVDGDAAATADTILDSRWLFAAALMAWIVILVLDIAIAVTFYVLLKPAGRTLSMLVAAFRLVYAAMLGGVLVFLFNGYVILTGTEQAADATMAFAAFETFDTGFLFALILFGVYLIALGYLLNRSRYIPRIFGALVALAGAAYIVDGLASVFVTDYGSPVNVVTLVPTVIGEPALAIWLLVKGVKST